MKYMIKKLSIIILGISIQVNAIAASHNPQEFLSAIQGSKDEGQQIVREYCATCHANKAVIELGAPKVQQIEDWGPRVKQGLDVLLQHTYEGYGAMPARGGCFECTDLQLKLAVLVMLPDSIRKDYK